MNRKLISTIYKNRKKSIFVNHNFIKLLYYGIKLKIGEISGRIYLRNELNNKLNIDLGFLEESTEDLDGYIRESLANIKIKNKIDFEKDKRFENVGMGCLFVPEIFGKIIVFSQKNASFYFKTDLKKPKTLVIELISIPKITGQIKFENTVIGKFSLNTFSEYKKTIKIDPELITQKISKVTILVDYCWLAGYVYKEIPDFPLGVGIKSLELV